MTRLIIAVFDSISLLSSHQFIIYYYKIRLFKIHDIIRLRVIVFLFCYDMLNFQILYKLVSANSFSDYDSLLDEIDWKEKSLDIVW